MSLGPDERFHDMAGLTDSDGVLVRNEGVVGEVIQSAQTVGNNLFITVLQLVEDVLQRVR